MNTTFHRSSRRSRATLLRRAALLATAGAALAVSATPAQAAFTLTSGNLKLDNGSTTGTPPPTGSWLSLPTDSGTGYLNNLSTTAASGEYTLLNGSASTGLNLGTAQPSGGLLGSLTSIYALPFDLFTVAGSAPQLSFTGSATGTGTRTLTAGDLSGLRFSWNGNIWNIGSTEAAGGRHTVPLTGKITGDSTSGNAQITLDWTSDITEPGWNGFRAKFHWVGTYTP